MVLIAVAAFAAGYFARWLLEPVEDALLAPPPQRFRPHGWLDGYGRMDD
jgi:hypothetical protein